MKEKSKKFKRVISFVVALTMLASVTAATVFAANAANDDNVKNNSEIIKYADDYTDLFPRMTDTKMKLSDPVFSDKDWYEYIEYTEFAEVKDGDITYRIYKPVDFGEASIMAIGDYNPKEVLGNSRNISMNLGELQGVFDMAQQGSNISKDFAGLNITSGIAENMNNIADVMDNSKYYSQSSFLGIPGDNKYAGVSNDGFFNADTISIEIIESETISTGKTVALNSNYSVAESALSGKDFSTYSEVGEANTNTKEESETKSTSDTVGNSMGSAISISEESSQSISQSISASLQTEVGTSIVNTVGAKAGFEAGHEGAIDGVVAKVSGEVSNETAIGVSASVAAGLETSQSSEQSHSVAVSNEQSVSQNVEKTDSTEHSKLASNSIENSIVNGTQNGKSEEHGKEISVDLGYGVDYQFENEHALSVGVTREFKARDDKEVKNVGWKLCEYVVKIPYYIEAVKTDATNEETVLYGQYVNYNLLNGVCRVFANGYIEHWYTGELVSYADFFDGFVTASDLVDKAKSQQAEKADSIN